MSRRMANTAFAQPPALDRREAARLLRAARALLASGRLDDAGDAIGRAHAALPLSRHAKRLKIELMLQVGEHDAAEALIAVSLLHRPHDASLRMQQARLLLERGRLIEASAAAQAARANRPGRVRPLVLAAEIQTALGEHAAAAALLRQAQFLRPRDQSILTKLVEALLSAGAADEADAVLGQLQSPHPLLAARVRRAQQRYADAIAILSEALADAATDDVHRDAMFAEFIAVADEMGDWPGLDRQLAAAAALPGPLSRIAAAEALVSLGEAQEALDLAHAAAQNASARGRTVQVQLAAAALLGKDEAVNVALDTLAESGRHVEPKLTARLLWRGMLGRLVRDHIEAGRCRAAAADPTTSVLQPLLRTAIATFESRAAGGDLGAVETRQLNHHRALCLMATGRTWEAMSARTASTRGERSQPRTATSAVPLQGDTALDVRKDLHRRAA